MNTYRIYEDLRASLGEEAAKSLAHTLGPMFEQLGETVTKVEFRSLDATVLRLAEAQRAAILRKAGLVALPLVACEVISPELLAYARSRQVRVWCNGTMLDAAA